MSKLGWFAIGVGVGAYAFKQLRDNPKAQEAVDELYSAAKDFGNSVLDGYRERESELTKPAPAAKKPAARKPAAKKPAASSTAKKK